MGAKNMTEILVDRPNIHFLMKQACNLWQVGNVATVDFFNNMVKTFYVELPKFVNFCTVVHTRPYKMMT